MLQIDNAIISFDVLEKKFTCNLKKCKGACCVHGDSGAPLEEAEAEILKELFPKIKPFMRAEGIESVEQQGVYVKDMDGDTVTPLINGKECAFVIFEGKVAKCSIEKAFYANAIPFQKPISCHLYPIRITKYSNFEALNYHEWDICKPAKELGEIQNSPIYQYLEAPLTRKYGKDWFDQLKIGAVEVQKSIR